MRKLHQTKTAKYNAILSGIQVLMGSQALFAAFLDPKTTVAIMALMGLIHGIGGVYVRYITSGQVEL